MFKYKVLKLTTCLHCHSLLFKVYFNSSFAHIVQADASESQSYVRVVTPQNGKIKGACP